MRNLASPWHLKVPYRRHPKEALTDLDFADAVRQAQELLMRLEEECSFAVLSILF